MVTTTTTANKLLGNGDTPEYQYQISILIPELSTARTRKIHADNATLVPVVYVCEVSVWTAVKLTPTLKKNLSNSITWNNLIKCLVSVFVSIEKKVLVLYSFHKK